MLVQSNALVTLSGSSLSPSCWASYPGHASKWRGSPGPWVTASTDTFHGEQDYFPTSLLNHTAQVTAGESRHVLFDWAFRRGVGCAQLAPPCAGCGRVQSFAVGKFQRGGRERKEGWEASTCSSHMQDVSEDVVPYFLVTFDHPENQLSQPARAFMLLARQPQADASQVEHTSSSSQLFPEQKVSTKATMLCF